MRKRACLLPLCASLVLLGWQERAQAQPEMTITVQENGQAVANAALSSVINGIKKPMGTTGSTGQAEFSLEILNLGKGTRVDVYARRCVDGQVELVMVPEGEDAAAACAADAEEGEGCTCERIGAFIWGEGPVTIDIGTGTVTQAGPEGGIETSGAGPRVRIAALANYFYLTEFEDVVGNQSGITSNDADGNAYGFTGQLEFRPIGTSGFTLGTGVSYARTSYEQMYVNGGPGSVDGDMTIWTGDGYAGWTWGPAENWSTHIAIFGGFAVVYNKLDLEFGDAPNGVFDDERSETGIRGLGGIHLDYMFNRRAALRLGASYLSGGSDDADSRIGLCAGLSFPIY